jgi:ATP-binding cassette, subfamily C, bacterial CydD
MRPPHPLATVWSVSGPACARDVAVSATLLCLERAGSVALAFEVLSGDRTGGLVAGGALAALYAARAIVRGGQRSTVQERLHQATARALLGGDMLRASPLDDEDGQGAVLEGAVMGSRFVSEVVPDLIGDALVGLAVAAAFVWAQPLGLVGISALALAGATAVAFAVRRVVRRAEERAWRAHGSVVDDLVAMLSGRLELVANGREHGFLADVRRRLADWRRESLRADRLSMVVGRLPMLAAVIGLAVAAGVEWPQQLSQEGGFLQLALVVAGLPALVGLARGSHELVRIATHVRAMTEILEGTAGGHARKGVAVDGALERLELREVGFTYAASVKPAIAGLSFLWRRGAPLVLAGPNGAGKSTTLRLLLGLAPPTTGSIRVGDHDLRDVDGESWRQRIAYLAQRPYLSDRATVREAIRMLAPAVDDDAMRAVLEKVEIWPALASSSATAPLDVRVGTLSVGQRQRVALARVLAVDAPVLLLDEPDANLDHAGILRVRAIVEELSPTKMIAVVAHTEELFDLAGTLVRLP